MSDLQLFADLKEDGESDPVIPIRWCVSPDLGKRLAKQGVFNPLLLLSVRTMSQNKDGHWSYAKETRRYLVPLTQEMTYVSFSRPGRNSVTGVVVNGSSRGSAGRFLMRRTRSGAYKENIYGRRFEGNNSYSLEPKPTTGAYIAEGKGWKADLLPITDEFFVQIPPQMFAKEQSQFAKDYIGKFFDSKPFDECHARRRWLLTIPLMPAVFLGGLLLRILLLLVNAVLLRFPLHTRGIRHPNHIGVEDVTSEAQPPRWWVRSSDRRHKEYRPQALPILLFNPINLFGAAAALFAITSIPAGRSVRRLVHVNNKWVYHWVGYPSHFVRMGWWTCVKWSGLFFGFLAVASLVGLCIATLVMMISGEKDRFSFWEQLAKRRKAKFEAAEAEKKRKAAERVEEELFAMACNGQASRVDLGALPKKKQTVRLRFQATKKKVCRPFAS